ncbi:hypothetical protein C2G38_2045566 [Gigaspora rosea]|uniref:Uncharacterized protein n=1 Tax=Gigaspora rosea TaxID=44941 RepID=A0A397UGQ1_9GLOM|nr:hypothetical protein C2G38_2045566 [Gigaspora rosea]
MLTQTLDKSRQAKLASQNLKTPDGAPLKKLFEHLLPREFLLLQTATLIVLVMINLKPMSGKINMAASTHRGNGKANKGLNKNENVKTYVQKALCEMSLSLLKILYFTDGIV